MKQIQDIWSRVGKTFVEAFFGVLIPQIVLILSNVLDYDWNHWWVWALPILGGAIGAGISAVWNNIINYLHKDDEIKKEV